MGGDNLILIAAVEAEEGARRKAGEPIEARARAAMEAVQNHWMVTNEDGQFRAALVGLLRSCDEDEKGRVEDEIRKLSRAAALIGALQSGVPVDWDSLGEEAEAATDEPEPIGLQRIWREVYKP